MVLELCLGFVFTVGLVLLLFYVVAVYNGLIQLRNNIDKAWANIDVLLKQRYDVIPNLVEVVKGYMKHEKAVLTEITKLRVAVMSGNTPTEKAKPSEALTLAVKNLLAVSENYPKLRANENFLKLQDQLTILENQIADRREFYNNSVLLFNTRIQSFPDSIFAGIFGMQMKEYFKATEEEKKNVEVILTQINNSDLRRAGNC